jgi:hypothetical protein
MSRPIIIDCDPGQDDARELSESCAANDSARELPGQRAAGARTAGDPDIQITTRYEIKRPNHHFRGKRTLGTVTEHRHTIKAGNQPVVLYTRPSSGAITTEYFLLDHLGSVDAIVGSTVLAESFSAFGERRNPNT